MSCSIASANEIAECLHQAKAWLSIAQIFWGLVSSSLLAALLFIVRRWRSDIERHETELKSRDDRIERLQADLKQHGYVNFETSRMETIQNVVDGWYHPRLVKHIEKHRDEAA